MAALSQANPSSISTASAHPTSPSDSPQTDLPKLESDPAPHPESLIRESPDPPKPEENSPNEKLSDDSAKEGIGGDGLGEEEEEGEKNKEDIVEKCVQSTLALRKCMEAHSDYSAPLLDAEEGVMKQLEEEEKSDDADKKESP
ncbi:uncharacterized protein LOC125195355 [Salvia hispanica]|uniref:uncharacterized protein LOC125195355 n=1 Tax=Salvia hispanica TaxID=49212 RepID=UPI002009785F|nr:uncharacterized protein LOC125195355 [Salvia hispanica]